MHDAFSALDCFRQGHLNRDDLKRIMQRNGFHSTESELTWLTARFDTVYLPGAINLLPLYLGAGVVEANNLFNAVIIKYTC